MRCSGFSDNHFHPHEPQRQCCLLEGIDEAHLSAVAKTKEEGVLYRLVACGIWLAKRCATPSLLHAMPRSDDTAASSRAGLPMDH